MSDADKMCYCEIVGESYLQRDEERKVNCCSYRDAVRLSGMIDEFSEFERMIDEFLADEAKEDLVLTLPIHNSSFDSLGGDSAKARGSRFEVLEGIEIRKNRDGFSWDEIGSQLVFLGRVDELRRVFEHLSIPGPSTGKQGDKQLIAYRHLDHQELPGLCPRYDRFIELICRFE